MLMFHDIYTIFKSESTCSNKTTAVVQLRQCVSVALTSHSSFVIGWARCTAGFICFSASHAGCRQINKVTGNISDQSVTATKYKHTGVQPKDIKHRK